MKNMYQVKTAKNDVLNDINTPVRFRSTALQLIRQHNKHKADMRYEMLSDYFNVHSLRIATQSDWIRFIM